MCRAIARMVPPELVERLPDADAQVWQRKCYYYCSIVIDQASACFQ